MTKVIRHELGHALKLSHVFEEEPYHDGYKKNTIIPLLFQEEVISIMTYEPTMPNYPSYNSNQPSFIDKYTLITKWGI